MNKVFLKCGPVLFGSFGLSGTTAHMYRSYPVNTPDGRKNLVFKLKKKKNYRGKLHYELLRIDELPLGEYESDFDEGVAMLESVQDDATGEDAAQCVAESLLGDMGRPDDDYSLLRSAFAAGMFWSKCREQREK